jgi:hypothetical protein
MASVKALVVAWWGSWWARIWGWWWAWWLVYDSEHTITAQAYSITIWNWGAAVTQSWSSWSL